ncbi:MAG: hypothetical protein KY468_10090, partial [Armatimonadetes bacterium]|nr:hypothetical protein [Armatimonadota bacterium]
MTIRSSNRSHPRLSSESGASLVEVLVVMVVLLVGVFTIIRIFPTGFDVLQYTGNATVAHRLAEAEVEFWRKNAENLPEAIVPILPGPPGYSVFDPTARPGDFTSGTGAYGDISLLRDDIRSKLGSRATEAEIDRWVGQNRQRRILGEITKIPAPSPVEVSGERYASIYTLAYAPIDWPETNPRDQFAADERIQIRGNSLFPVDVTNTPESELPQTLQRLRSRQYGINYKEALVYFPRSSRPRYFLASYTYRSGEGLKTVRSDRLVVPPTQTNPRGSQLPASVVQLGVNQPGSGVTEPGKFFGIEPGTEDVAPKFRYLPDNTPFSNEATDPYGAYEYKVLSRYPLGVQFTAALAFNPRGYAQQERGIGGVAVPLRARIDYIVKDWRVLHQDVTVPAEQAPYRVRLALPFYKQAGETVGDDSLEPWPGLGNPAQRLSIIAVDTSNG